MAKRKKKAAKKKVAKQARKKAAAPAHIRVSIQKKVFGEAPEQHEFVLHDGRKLNTVYQLIDELETMSEEVFQHHVNGERNDFANWLSDVFDEQSLADEINAVHDRIATQRALMKKLMRELQKLEPPHKIQHSSKCVMC